MTAIVGILNRRGIAIAADSASTINTDKGRKVLNTETKIFQLSKQHPVAVMIYGKAEFALAEELGIIYEVKEEQGINFETAYKLELKKEMVTGRLSSARKIVYFKVFANIKNLHRLKIML